MVCSVERTRVILRMDLKKSGIRPSPAVLMERKKLVLDIPRRRRRDCMIMCSI